MVEPGVQLSTGFVEIVGGIVDAEITGAQSTLGGTQARRILELCTSRLSKLRIWIPTYVIAPGLKYLGF